MIRIFPETMKLPEAAKKSLEEDVDLSQLYERLRMTPTQRIQRSFQMLRLAEELRKAGQEKRDRSRS